jgi:two-component system, NarL family, sensor histidine kinase UhpB
VASTRRIASELRPTMLDDLGLVPAVEWLVQSFRERTRIDGSLTVLPADLDLRDPHATAIYRIVQESLTNVAKHAKAAFVEVRIERDQDDIRVTVRDNGRGFAAEAQPKEGSFGLMGLRERAYFLGGKVDIESKPGQGTIVRVLIPSEIAARVPAG